MRKVKFLDYHLIERSVICGNFIIVGDDGSGEDLSLTDEQINKYKERFGKESIRKTYRVIESLFNKKNRER